MEIEKRCQWCGKQFIAHKMTTLYCSSTCVNKAYKAKKRQMKKEEIESEQDSKLPTVESIGQKPFLSPKEAAYLLGIRTSPWTASSGTSCSAPSTSSRGKYYWYFRWFLTKTRKSLLMPKDCRNLSLQKI